jgi:hypothetical protein
MYPFLETPEKQGKYLSIPHILCQTSRMRNLTATICLTIAVLFGLTGVKLGGWFPKGFGCTPEWNIIGVRIRSLIFKIKGKSIL